MRRQELGLSQRALADEGVSYAYISRIEAGARRPSVRALRVLAPKLGVSAHWLETGDKDPADTLADLILSLAPGEPVTKEARSLARRVKRAREGQSGSTPCGTPAGVPKCGSRRWSGRFAGPEPSHPGTLARPLLLCHGADDAEKLRG